MQTEPQRNIRCAALTAVGAAVALAVFVGRSSATAAVHTKAVLAEAVVWNEQPGSLLSVAMIGFDRVGDRPCPSGSYLSGEPQDSRAICVLTCKANPDCRFVSYCPSGEDGCTGLQENKCGRYSSCDAFDADYQGYTTFKLTLLSHGPSPAEAVVWNEQPGSLLSVAMIGFDRVGDRPCPSGSYLSGESQDSRAICVLTCKAHPDCRFVAYCPSGEDGCTGLQENKCWRYSSCDAFDADYQGYTTFKLTLLSHGPSPAPLVPDEVMKNFVNIGDRPCQGKGYLGHEQRASQEACAATCTSNPQCKFIAFCPSGEKGCTGPQESNCVHYSSCDDFDTAYQGYISFKLAQSPHESHSSHGPSASVLVGAASSSAQAAPSPAPLVIPDDVMKDFENISDRPCTGKGEPFEGCEQEETKLATDLGPSGCSSSRPCGECHGDCDRDEDCALGLSCWHSATGEMPPGCNIAGLDRRIDWCYKSDKSHVGFDFYAPEPCAGDSQNVLGSERQKSEETCMLTCKSIAECKFVAYCPEGKDGCLGSQRKNCVRYKSCTNLDASFPGYTTHKRKEVVVA